MDNPVETIRIICEQFDEDPPRKCNSIEATIARWIDFARIKGACVYESGSNSLDWYIAFRPISEGDRRIF
jgi:hypothetical protein